MPVVESFGITDIGPSRSNNEDIWGELPEGQFYVLADGIGGYPAGEVAAKEAVLRMCDRMEKFLRCHPMPTSESAKKSLKEAFEDANQWIRKRGNDHPHLRGMGTTLSCLLVLNHRLVYAHIGDSRIYHFNNRIEKLKRLTRDHSLSEELIRNRQNKGPLRRNVLTRALGISFKVEPEIQETVLETGDLYFLCSDGLHEPLSDSEMERVLSSPCTIKEKTIGLVEAAKQAGSHDNITILMIRSLAE